MADETLNFNGGTVNAHTADGGKPALDVRVVESLAEVGASASGIADAIEAKTLTVGTIGTSTDPAVTSDATGTLQQYLRGLVKLIAAATDLVNGFFKVSLATGLTKDNDEIASVWGKASFASGTLASTTAAVAVPAPSAGNHLEILRLFVQLTADGANNLTWRDGAVGTDILPARLLLDGDYAAQIVNGALHCASATALYIKASTTVACQYSVIYRTVSDAARS